MLDLDQHIKNIQEKLQQLLRNQQVLVKENQRLVKELEKSKQLLLEKEETVLMLHQQLDALKLSTTAQSPEEKALLEKRINGYLKEIDKCLALLNT